MPIFCRSGELENDEFGDLLEGLGVVTTYQQKEDMINELDVDGSGTVTLAELAAMRAAAPASRGRRCAR